MSKYQVNWEKEKKLEANYLINSDSKIINFIAWLLDQGRSIEDAASICFYKKVRGLQFGHYNVFLNKEDFISAAKKRWGTKGEASEASEVNDEINEEEDEEITLDS